MAASSTNNPFAHILDKNKLSGTENFKDWEMDLRIFLDSEKTMYILDNAMPIVIPEESTPEEQETFQKWKDDNLRVRSYILSSMSPELKRQYVHAPDSYSIMTRLRELFMNQE